MNKPFTMQYKEFANNLASLINNSGLPAVVVSDILQKAIHQLMKQADMQYESDKKAYQDALKKEQETESSES